jgi:ADP-ribose pyrophosphatase YjhB (NUDIX family)
MARRPRTSQHRDPAGKTLADYPRPSVAVDVALLTVASDALAVLLVYGMDPVDGTKRWSLPGGFVHERQRLSDAVVRVLRDKHGIVGLSPRQLHVFDDPERDPRGWVMSVGHASAVAYPRLEAALSGRSDLYLAPVRPGSPARLHLPDEQKALPFDHDNIVDLAVQDIRARYAEHSDPDRLLGSAFTVKQLQTVHEAVAGDRFHKDAFRRLMSPHLVAVTGEFHRGEYGPPAQLFRRKGDRAARAAEAEPSERAGYTDDELLAAVAEYTSDVDTPTVEGYRLWARATGRPSEAWVRKRLADKLGGWPGIVATSQSKSALP